MSQINSECMFFLMILDDKNEVNSLLSGVLIDVALVIQASTPTIQKYQRSYMPRDRTCSIPSNLKVGKAPEVPFVANDVTYKWGYYLTDGIYPEWVVLMKSISQPGSNDVKRIRYKQAHEAARKDVKQAFGVLKKKWAIVRTPARSRSLKRITHLMYTCIILHNMIRKEKGKAISPDFYPEEQHREDDPVRSAQDRLRVIREIHDEETHLNLKADLVEHIWHRTNAN
ncbi:ALP1-like protein [Tanacetum coccineum]|uniref:ALP1-like protein n=1 Tax=Tanacetum coccineum TaxID=301880 RepID=A0ABQ5I6D6_9ASTR